MVVYIVRGLYIWLMRVVDFMWGLGRHYAISCDIIYGYFVLKYTISADVRALQRNRKPAEKECRKTRETSISSIFCNTTHQFIELDGPDSCSIYSVSDPISVCTMR